MAEPNGNGQPRLAQMTITVNLSTGRLQELNGPLHNLLLCYGMLKAAEVGLAKLEIQEEQAQQRVIVPDMELPGGLRRL